MRKRTGSTARSSLVSPSGVPRNIRETSGRIRSDLRPFARQTGCGLNVHMFIAQELVIEVACHAAQVRLANLIHSGALSGTSQATYERGWLHGFIRAGPFGDAPGASKLVQVGFLDPVCRDGIMTVGLRWEATGATGGLFPVLDADIALRPAGGNATRLVMAGSYRAPCAPGNRAGNSDPASCGHSDHPRPARGHR